jgi:magnesium chelatase subunit I
MCPRRLVEDDGAPTLLKCCLLEESIEVEGNRAIVPWGANLAQVHGHPSANGPAPPWSPWGPQFGPAQGLPLVLAARRATTEVGAAMANSFPFSAIVGQDAMKQALLIAAVEPAIGGVLVFGDRGTGKSTAIRALAGLLPPMTVVAGCAYHCDPQDPAGFRCGACTSSGELETASVQTVPVPVVDLPLGATEDRLVGALDLERALTRGEKAFEPGLLARAHRGFLYIDEINLLEDHLVDLLLDVAASGENVVEREGLSVRHPARFVLVGSGNPEEGELRPQLLDRFGLSVEVTTPDDLESRVEVIRRRDAFERDPSTFLESWREAEQAIRAQVREARTLSRDVAVPEAVLEQTARLCMALGSVGLRGVLTLIRAARALAALEAAATVRDEHLRQAAPAALRHRLRRDPLDEAGSSVRVERALATLFAD